MSSISSLAPPFVRHYHRYADSNLPVAHAIATMPLVLIAPRGVDGDLGIIFRSDPKRAAILPRPGSVKREAVTAAMKFLLDDWLVDVTATISSKCVLIVWGRQRRCTRPRAPLSISPETISRHAAI